MSENAKNPPRWAEWLLEHLLPEDAREGIVGDLREEYVESLLPCYGRVVAALWYLRHVLSFVPSALRESRTMGKVLIFISGFTMTCMFWLASMEMALRHPGYGTRWHWTFVSLSRALRLLFCACSLRHEPGVKYACVGRGYSRFFSERTRSSRMHTPPTSKASSL